MKLKIILAGVFAFLFLMVSGILVSAQDANESLSALEEVKGKIQEANESGFNTLRMLDLLATAEQLFDAQQALEARRGESEYALVNEKIEEINELLEQQLETSDELIALERRLEGLRNDSEAFSLFREAKQEFEDERYEKISDIIEETYRVISEEEAIQTRIRTFYSSSRQSIVRFIRTNWRTLGITLFVFIILYFSTHKKIRTHYFDNKIRNLELERGVLQRLIKQSQDEYFRLFKIPEELYFIRIKKFGELIRDINRQIPLLIESRERVRRKEPEKVVPKEGLKRHEISEVPVKYGFNKDTFLLLARNLKSYIKLRAIVREAITEFSEERKRKLIVKRRKKLEASKRKEERKRMSEVMRLVAGRAKEQRMYQRKERSILFKKRLHDSFLRFYENLLHILHIRRKLKITKKGGNLLKEVKRRGDVKKQERQEKEDEYVQSLLRERGKPDK